MLRLAPRFFERFRGTMEDARCAGFARFFRAQGAPATPPVVHLPLTRAFSAPAAPPVVHLPLMRAFSTPSAPPRLTEWTARRTLGPLAEVL
ncbi:hypothetical protein B8V81_4718 [Paenibacillus pasadenensis]|uniref:Uncharacterized protein n=1 Tax=Paenibacillus pasadenensis TaxID=217090 RepID=A0A2N5N7F3_9BACL|nr:hypothetical protein B8V81_4718 [Paenibacillus pasadenensis]